MNVSAYTPMASGRSWWSLSSRTGNGMTAMKARKVRLRTSTDRSTRGDDGEDAVVGEPQPAEDDEAQRVGADRREQVAQLPRQRRPLQVGRHLQPQGQQGDRDREHGVGEGEHPAGVDRAAPQQPLPLALLLLPRPPPGAPLVHAEWAVLGVPVGEHVHQIKRMPN